MILTLKVPKKWNYTPSDLMRTFAQKSSRYEYTYDYYYTSILKDRKTQKCYYYDHLERTNNRDLTETVTVFLKEKEIRQ